MESIKAYSIPTTAPKDLIEEYFKLRKTVLGEILKHVKYFKSGKAHLKFDKNKRKEFRDVIACLNLRMWGIGVAPNGDEPFGDVSQCGHNDYVR